jgi:hypothetical protein
VRRWAESAEGLGDGFLHPGTLPSRNNTTLRYCIATVNESAILLRATMASNTRKAGRAFMTCRYLNGQKSKSGREDLPEVGPRRLANREVAEVIQRAGASRHSARAPGLSASSLCPFSLAGEAAGAMDGCCGRRQAPSVLMSKSNSAAWAPRGVLVGERFSTSKSKRVFLGLIADRFAFDVALLGPRLIGHSPKQPARTTAVSAVTTIKTVVLVAISAPQVG